MDDKKEPGARDRSRFYLFHPEEDRVEQMERRYVFWIHRLSYSVSFILTVYCLGNAKAPVVEKTENTTDGISIPANTIAAVSTTLNNSAQTSTMMMRQLGKAVTTPGSPAVMTGQDLSLPAGERT